MSLLSGSVRELTNARPMDVAVVNGTGDQLTGFDSSRPSTAALTTVAASATSVSLLAANANRRQFFIVNNGSKTLYVAFAATATTGAFTFIISSNGTYISPVDGYTGVISGIWNTANGNAQVTEITT